MKDNSYQEVLYSLEDLEDRGFNVKLKKINSFDKYLISAEIGSGKKTILSTYALHGDESAACYSFVESAKNIAEKYEQFLTDLTFKVVFCNPWAARNGVRKTIDYYKGTNELVDKIDLNRLWFHENIITTELVSILRQEIDKIIKEGVELHIDHHAYSRFLPSTITILKKNKFNDAFLNKTNEFINELDYRTIPKWKLNIYGHALGFEKTPLEKILAIEPGYYTMSEYLSKKGINSVLFESSGKKLKNKKLNQGIKQHIKLDSFMIGQVINQTIEYN